MKKFVLAALIVCAGIAASVSPARAAHVFVGIGGGGYYHGYYGGYSPYYAPYYYGAYPEYYAPPPVTYIQPPTTYYGDAQPYAVPQQAPEQLAPPQTDATQTSNTFKDKHGRLCRRFKSTLEDGTPVDGTACQLPDGTWKTTD